MSVQRQQVATRSINPRFSISSSSIAEAFLRRMVGDLECGELVIETPAGHRLVLGERRSGPQAKVTIRSWRCLWRMISSWDIGVADAYIAGEWSSPDLVALLKLACNNSALAEPLKALRAPPFWLRLRHADESQYASREPAKYFRSLRPRQRVLPSVARSRHDLLRGAIFSGGPDP